MRRTLYRKLILIYVILAIAGFTLISTVGSRMVEDSLVSRASTSLYREATQIASKQGDLYYHSERSLTDLYNSLSALASYHNSRRSSTVLNRLRSAASITARERFSAISKTRC